MCMKVILLQDVAKIGKRFSVVEVPDGYALNQLIPKRMAEAATPANLKKIERRQAETAATKEADLARFQAAKTILTANKITVLVEANEQGHLFKAVHETEIADAAQTMGADIESVMVKIEKPIKELGDHSIQLVSGTQVADITIEVIKK
jgi:large subunit ribosomal protein L9